MHANIIFHHSHPFDHVILSKIACFISYFLCSDHHTSTNNDKYTTSPTPSCSDLNSDHFHPKVHVNPIRIAKLYTPPPFLEDSLSIPCPFLNSWWIPCPFLLFPGVLVWSCLVLVHSMSIPTPFLIHSHT